jgi:DNA-binding transcriptional regulator YhcF (GntR family)
LISTQQGRGTYIWEAPADEAMQQLRQRGLRELVQHVFAEAERMGYSIEEVEQAFAEGIQEWKIKLAAND